MNDIEILQHLKWLYHERKLCCWCRHPSHLPKRRGLCGICYELARAFKKSPSLPLAVAIDLATREGVVDVADYTVSGLDLEHRLETISRATFPWRCATDNPFWHSANIWNDCFSDAQRRLLFHYLSLITLERVRKSRRTRARAYARELHLQRKEEEICAYMTRAEAAVRLLS